MQKKPGSHLMIQLHTKDCLLGWDQDFDFVSHVLETPCHQTKPAQHVLNEQRFYHVETERGLHWTVAIMLIALNCPVRSYKSLQSHSFTVHILMAQDTQKSSFNLTFSKPRIVHRLPRGKTKIITPLHLCPLLQCAMVPSQTPWQPLLGVLFVDVQLPNDGITTYPLTFPLWQHECWSYSIASSNVTCISLHHCITH